jgi:hypothetical protein
MKTTTNHAFASSKPSSKGLGTFVLALLGALLCVSAAACGSEEGTTPACTPDIDLDGKNTNAGKGADASKDGCNPFGRCIIDGEVRDASECCQDFGGGNVDSYEYKACMYGYGAGEEPL